MPTSRSSSNQNTRVFSPTVVLSQETQSIFITLKSGDANYSMQGGLTAGDVIYYNPSTETYTKSQADSEDTAEVVGVIESISGNSYKVVISGSIVYPQTRLDLIKDEDGGTTKLDILFLDPQTAGGLTGYVDAPATGEDPVIVKPVIQLAPHSIYNGIVVNYIGYKIGNGAAAATNLVPVGNVVYAAETSSPGEYYKRIDEGLVLSATEYTDLYNIYGTSYGTHKTVITLDSATNISSTLVGKTVQVYNNGLTTIGTVSAVSSTAKTLTLSRSSTSSTIPTSGTIYCNGHSWTLVSQQVTEFTVPPVPSTITQGTLKLIPFISTKNQVNVSIPETTTLQDVVVSSNLGVGTITDVEQAIIQIQTDINTIKNILRIGGS